jgi:lysophospholipase L1-like esterase
MFGAPDGRLFNAGPDGATRYLDTTGTGLWTTGPVSNFGDRAYGSAVLYEPGKVLIAGGGSTPTATAEILDLAAASPAWRFVDSMGSARRDHTAVLLPDGTVLVVGGTSSAAGDAAGAVGAAELWNPSTERWASMASLSEPRVANSAAILLPDGRVVVAGSDGHPSAQLFSPPYLFKGARPVVASAPSIVTYGGAFPVGTTDAADIAQVTWVRLPSVSHSFDQNQRFNRLAFTVVTGGVSVTVPDAASSPPGHYMLFLVNRQGVPSIARIVNLLSAPPAALKIMPLGDSLTYGLGMPEYGGYRVDLLQKLLAAGMNVDFVGSLASGPGSMSDRDNEGHVGWDITEIQAMVNEWLTRYTPKVILLMIGTNDVIEGRPSPASDLDVLIGQIYAKLPQATLVVSSIPPLGGSQAAKNPNVVAYNALIPGIVNAHAAMGRSVHVIDSYVVVSPSDLTDGIHINAAGYSRIAQLWFDKLMQLGVR